MLFGCYIITPLAHDLHKNYLYLLAALIGNGSVAAVLATTTEVGKQIQV